MLAAVERVHDAELARRLREACGAAPAIFDCPDNPISAGSYRAATAAVACSLTAVGAALRGEAVSVFVAARPPGHHALRDRAMGFCFFNNVAIAAEELLARSVGPVAIVDFDVHRGHGSSPRGSTHTARTPSAGWGSPTKASLLSARCWGRRGEKAL